MKNDVDVHNSTIIIIQYSKDFIVRCGKETLINISQLIGFWRVHKFADFNSDADGIR